MELTLIVMIQKNSIGIPTWRYGKEPSNGFATRHAKFFSSALRLDALVAVASGGIIFTPGGAGKIFINTTMICYNTQPFQRNKGRNLLYYSRASFFPS